MAAPQTGASFQGKRFIHVEIAAGALANRRWARVHEARAAAYNIPVWKSVYSYPDRDTATAHYGPLHFEADAKDDLDFERIHEDAKCLVAHLIGRYSVPKEALELKYTRRSIWVIVPPQVFGAAPSPLHSATCREMARAILGEVGLSGWDLGVYSRSQLTRVPGSWIPEAARYVIHLTADELMHGFKELYDGMATAPRVFPYKKPVMCSLSLYRLYADSVKAVRQRASAGQPGGRGRRAERACLAALAAAGAEEGTRNALFYGLSLDACAAGEQLEEWLAHAQDTTSNNQGGPMRRTEAAATSRSAFNGRHRFSCTAFRDKVTDRYCESCPYREAAPAAEDVFRIGRATLLSYLQRKASASDLYRLARIAAGELQPTSSERLTLESTAKLARRSYIQLPISFVSLAEQLGPVLRTYLVLASMARNSNGRLLLSPKLHIERIAERTGLHLKTVKRHLDTLHQLGLWTPGHGQLHTETIVQSHDTPESSPTTPQAPTNWQTLHPKRAKAPVYLRRHTHLSKPVTSCSLVLLFSRQRRKVESSLGRAITGGVLGFGLAPPVASSVEICHSGYRVMGRTGARIRTRLRKGCGTRASPKARL